MYRGVKNVNVFKDDTEGLIEEENEEVILKEDKELEVSYDNK